MSAGRPLLTLAAAGAGFAILLGVDMVSTPAPAVVATDQPAAATTPAVGSPAAPATAAGAVDRCADERRVASERCELAVRARAGAGTADDRPVVLEEPALGFLQHQLDGRDRSRPDRNARVSVRPVVSIYG